MSSSKTYSLLIVEKVNWAAKPQSAHYQQIFLEHSDITQEVGPCPLKNQFLMQNMNKNNAGHVPGGGGCCKVFREHMSRSSSCSAVEIPKQEHREPLALGYTQFPHKPSRLCCSHPHSFQSYFQIWITLLKTPSL